MPLPLPPSALKVQQALAAYGLACRVVELPQSTRTAREAAAAIGCGVGQIVKSLVFRGVTSGRPVLVAASGPNRVDEAKLGAFFGEPVEKADADYVRQKTGFAIGGVPPVALAEPMAVYVDEDLMAYGEIWAAAGTPKAVFVISPADLLRITGGRVAGVKS